MAEPLSDQEKFILRRLAVCPPNSGMVTADFAFLLGRQPGADSTKQHSARVLTMLRGLEVRGFVKRADGERPVLWRVASWPGELMEAAC